MMRRVLLGCAVMAGMLFAASITHAQIILVKSVVANGGGPSGNSTLSLNGTVGQPAIGVVSSGSIIHSIGFWYPTEDQPGSVDNPTTGYAAGGNVLFQNYPNPFRSTTTIRFSLAQRAEVSLRVFNMPGQEIAMLANGQFEAGEHRVEMSKELPSGTYFYQLQVGSTVLRRQMVVTQ